MVAGASHNRKVRESLLGVWDIGFLSVGMSHVSTLDSLIVGLFEDQIKNGMHHLQKCYVMPKKDPCADV